MRAKSLQLCPAHWDPMGCSLPDSSVHGILQARVLEWVAIAFSDMVHRVAKRVRLNWSNLAHTYIIYTYFKITLTSFIALNNTIWNNQNLETTRKTVVITCSKYSATLSVNWSTPSFITVGVTWLTKLSITCVSVRHTDWLIPITKFFKVTLVNCFPTKCIKWFYLEENRNIRKNYTSMIPKFSFSSGLKFPPIFPTVAKSNEPTVFMLTV